MSSAHVTILGSNSAVSVFNRFPSGQVFTTEHSQYLIDCGEGTQFRMHQYGVKKSRIKAIFITHLHGDHVFGLPGLITSYQLSGRKEKLTVFGPQPIKKYLDLSLGGIGHFISFPLEIVEIDPNIPHEKFTEIYSDHRVKVEAFHLYHRISCFGYKFTEQEKRPKLNRDFLDTYQPDVASIKRILNGEDFYTDEGVKIAHEKCTQKPVLPTSFAYCSDTIFHEPLGELLENTSCIYHESTYLEPMKNQAAERYHSTAYQAGIIAELASAQKLILGHYSSRYKIIEEFAEEASKSYAGEIVLAVEGKCVEL